MEKIKALGEAKQLLAEYNALPDLDARINWNGYDRLPDYIFRCVCGHTYICPMGIDDLAQTIVKGWEWKLEHYQPFCYGHEADEENEKDEEIE